MPPTIRASRTSATAASTVVHPCVVSVTVLFLGVAAQLVQPGNEVCAAGKRRHDPARSHQAGPMRPAQRQGARLMSSLTR